MPTVANSLLVMSLPIFHTSVIGTAGIFSITLRRYILDENNYNEHTKCGVERSRTYMTFDERVGEQTAGEGSEALFSHG